MDEQTGLVMGGGVAAGWAAKEVFKPSLQYVGERLRDRIAKPAINNIERIIEKGAKKLRQPSGGISDRVMGRLVLDGGFNDSEFAVEYFGGVLAASVSEDGKDDRGVPLMALVGRLSSQQLRAHYVVYSMLHGAYAVVARRNLGALDQWDNYPIDNLGVEVEQRAFVRAMGMRSMAEHQSSILVESALRGLARELLIGDYKIGRQLESGGDNLPKYVIVQPTASGVELFLWAHGHSDLPLRAIRDPDVELTTTLSLDIDLSACDLSHSY